MALLDQIQHPWLTWAGLVLTHSLWQGATVALFVAILLAVIPRRLAGLRAHACHLGMLAMLLAPVLTMSVIKPPATTWYAAVPSNAAPQETGSILVQPTTATAHIPIDEPLPLATDSNNASSEFASLAEPFAPAISGQPTDSATAQSPRRQWQPAALASVAIVWACGVSLLTLRLLIGWAHVRRLRRRATALPHPLEQAATRMLERFGLLGRAIVMATVDIASPVAIGLFRPIVLVPVSLISRCPVEHLEALIAHELAHIRRHDLWFALVQRLVETLFFYHPAVWWISGRTSVERELCCDDLAVSTTGQRTVYATALLEASKEVLTAARPALAAGVFGSRVTLTERVRRALQLPSQSQSNHSWLVVPLCLAMAGALLLAAHVQANDVTKPDGSPSVADATEPAEHADTPADETEIQEPDAIQPITETTYIETRLDQHNESLEAERIAERRVLAEIAPIAAAAQAIPDLRDALYDDDLPGFQRFYRPPGQAVTQALMDQMRSDLDKMKFKEFGKQWAVSTIDIFIPLGVGFIECESDGHSVLQSPTYSDAADGISSDPVKVRVSLGANIAKDEDNGQWYVTKLAIFGRKEMNSAQVRFCDDLLKHYSDDNSVQRLSARFNERTGAVLQYAKMIPKLDESGGLSWDRIGGISPYNADQHSELRGPFLQQKRLDEEGKRIAELQRNQDDWICVYSPWKGVVKNVLVAVGQEVQEGDILVEFENHETKLQLRAAEIQRDKLYRTLEAQKEHLSPYEKANMESDLELAEIDIELWRSRLDRTQILSPIAGTVVWLDRSVEARYSLKTGSRAVWILPRQTAPSP